MYSGSMHSFEPIDSQQKTASFEAAFGDLAKFGQTLDLRSNASISGLNNNVKCGVDPTGIEPVRPDFSDPAPKPGGPTPHLSYHLFGIALFSILVLIPPAYVLGSKMFAPAPELVSPLSEVSSSSPSLPSQPAATKVYTPSDYLYLSQRYFADAQMLSQKRQQTDGDKKDILGKLQKAIDTISEGISLYPNKAELWAQRANFYIAIQNIAPQAKEVALHDIEKAQSISQHTSTISTPNIPKGLELIKDQQADSRDVIVAAPGETSSPYEDTKETSAITGTGVFPAGQTEFTIANASVTDAAPVYVVPKTQTSGVLTVIKKIAGSGFMVALDTPQTTDVPFQYWITR